MGKATVLLADDDPELLVAVTKLLEQEFEVVACVHHGHALIEAAKLLNPDVIVSDISMPLLSGFHAVRRIKAERPDARVIFLTVHTEPAFVAEAQRMSALGYVFKQCIPSHLIPAIREVLQDRSFVCTSLQR
jgi:DNA-binding NarL/FixJ family response regulator